MTRASTLAAFTIPAVAMFLFLACCTRECVVAAATTNAADSVHGQQLFQRRCAGCHALNADREGPRLGGVYGRKAGSVPGFEYSVGLKKYGVVWDEGSLDRWLANPDAVVPDTNMSAHVREAEDRRDLIAYLRQTK